MLFQNIPTLEPSLPTSSHSSTWSLQDMFIKNAMKRIKQRITEQDLWVDGDFVSEEDMKADGIPEKLDLFFLDK